MKCLKPKLVVRKDIVKDRNDLGYYWKMAHSRDFVRNHMNLYMLVPCGHCRACRKSKTREWSTRLVYEQDSWSKSSFISLDYDPEHLPMVDGEVYGSLRQSSYNYGSTLVKDEVPRFMKRVRQAYFRKNNENLKCKYYYCGEYGDKHGRPHYHILMFGLDVTDRELLESCWKIGRVDIGEVCVQTVQYVAGYTQKKLNGRLAEEVYGNRLAPFGHGSLGLGLQYFQEHFQQMWQDKKCHLNGHRVTVPRYFLKKYPCYKDMLLLEDSPTLLSKLVDDPKQFMQNLKNDTANSVRGVQTHTRDSVF